MAVKIMMETDTACSCVRIYLLCQCTHLKIMREIEVINHSWYNHHFKIT